MQLVYQTRDFKAENVRFRYVRRLTHRDKSLYRVFDVGAPPRQATLREYDVAGKELPPAVQKAADAHPGSTVTYPL